jgi:hypothetical protein
MVETLHREVLKSHGPLDEKHQGSLISSSNFSILEFGVWSSK